MLYAVKPTMTKTMFRKKGPKKDQKGPKKDQKRTKIKEK